ncbi:MAG TPA: dihydroorotate dehydrogenase-like protein, partial [Vicinamibacteria bacterium]|nr:dihydroorotate dehydrogenase-like protein [Vicinamibacteria bacterium]
MDLSTQYLGLKLPNPFVAGASPLADDVDQARRVEDAGASAIVMRSLFAEQIARERMAAYVHLDRHGESFAEALSYFPTSEAFVMGPDEYVEQLRRLREALDIPVIASLNGTTRGDWLEYATLLESVGASALELNVYHLATDTDVTSGKIEADTLEVIREVKRRVRIPVAVKLSPFYTALAHFATMLDEASVDGLVLFNRFYQPDIDPDALNVVPSLQLSKSPELLLRLRWLAVLSGRIRASLAVTGGVHDGLGVVKAVMAGADVVQMVSALLARGPRYIRAVREEVVGWMDEHEYES